MLTCQAAAVQGMGGQGRWSRRAWEGELQGRGGACTEPWGEPACPLGSPVSSPLSSFPSPILHVTLPSPAHAASPWQPTAFGLSGGEVLETQVSGGLSVCVARRTVKGEATPINAFPKWGVQCPNSRDSASKRVP